LPLIDIQAKIDATYSYRRRTIVGRSDMPSMKDQNVQTLKMEALEEDLYWNYLPSNFPEEFKELCQIPPIHGNAILMDEVKRSLGEIVFRYHRQFSEQKDYYVRIEQCIKCAESAENLLQKLFDLFLGMDTEHRGATLAVANMIDSKRFPDQTDREFVGSLTAIMDTMRLLSVSVQIGTGVPSTKPTRGRPVSPFIRPAQDLIEAWESITAQPMKDIDGFWIKHVRTPRPFAKGKDKNRESSPVEHSTAFIRICFKMINPKITNSQVITSIKHAVKIRAAIHQAVTKKNGMSGDLPLAFFEAVIARK
jgi:hypothetical protein